MRRLLGLTIGLLVGGILGHYQFFCPGGTCPLTSTWLGGAAIGGLLGFLLLGGCPACADKAYHPTETSTGADDKTS